MGDLHRRTSSENDEMKWRSFAKARKFARSLGLKTGQEWATFCKSEQRPKDIPTNPNVVYKNKGWEDRGDWLGTDYIVPSKRQYRSFENARKFVQSLELKNTIDWNKYCNSKKLPKDIPRNPQKIYKNEWKTWKYFIGNEFLPYKEAGKFIRKQGITSQPQYEKWCKDGNRPSFIPATPYKTYKLKGDWQGWGDFIGTGRIADRQKAANYLPMREAKPIYRRLAKEYGLKNRADWKKFSITHKKLLRDLRIPQSPWQSYDKQLIRRKMK